jgi:hypothetical protein
MAFFYILWWLIWTAERLPNSFESNISIDVNDPDYIEKFAKQLSNIYFFLGLDLFINCLVILCTDINWIIHTSILILYVII